MNSQSGATFSPSPEAVAVFNKMPDELSNDAKVAVNRYINKRVSRGAYNQQDLFVLCAGLGSSNNAKIDWINTRNAVLGHLGAGADPTWANTTGFSTNGNTGGTGNYIRSSFVCSTAFSNAQAADHIVWAVMKGRSLATGSVGCLFGVISPTSARQFSVTQVATGVAYKDASTTTNTSTYWDQLMPISMHAVSRQTTSVRYNYNGQNVAVGTQTDSGTATIEFTLGGRNNNGTIDQFMACEILAYGVQRRSTVNMSMFFVDLETCLMELGVIPQSSTYAVSTTSSSSNDAIVHMIGGQSLAAGTNNSVSAPSDLTGQLDAVIAARAGSNLANPLTISVLEAGTNNNFENNTVYSQELRLAKEISSIHSGQRYSLLKYAIEGSIMYNSTLPDTDSWFIGGNGVLSFDWQSRFIVPGLNALAATKNIKIRAIEFYQGQSDAMGEGGADPNWKENYSAHLNYVINSIDAAGYNLTSCWVIVHRILNRFNPVRAFANAVRADQDEMPTYFPTAYPSASAKIAGIIVVNNDDTILSSDTVHETADAIEVRALRVARFVLSKV